MKRNITRLLLLVAAMLPAALYAQLALPYSEDFESYSTGGTSLPTGWTRIQVYQSSATAQKPNIQSTSAYYGHGNVLDFGGQNSTLSGTMSVATPLIPAALNSLEITFDLKGDNLRLYAATDPTDEATYAQIGGTYTSGYPWVHYEVRTDTMQGIPAQNGYIVMVGVYGASGYSTAMFDNFTITASNACERPNEVTVDGVTPTTALLSWTAVAGEVDYRVSYSLVDDLATADYVETNDTYIILEDLEPAAHYYVWVQTLCSETSESDPRTAAFNTQGSCYPIQHLRMVGVNSYSAAFQWDFDDQGYDPTEVVTMLVDLTEPTGDEYWEPTIGMDHHFFEDLDATHDYVAYFRTVCDEDSAEAVSLPIVFRNCGESELTENNNNVSQVYPLTSFYNYSYTQMTYPASVLYDMDTLRGIALRRDTTYANGDVTRTLSIWLADVEQPATGTQSVSGMTQVANDVQYLLKGQEWDTLMFTTPFVHSAGSYLTVTVDDNTGTNLYLNSTPKWRFHDAEWKLFYKLDDDNNINPASVSSPMNSMTLPDVRFVGECSADFVCEAPVAAFNYVDSTVAELEWIGGIGNVWTIQYRPAGTYEWTTAGTATSSPYTVTGLVPGTAYQVRIGVACSQSEIRYGRPIDFATECAPVHVPFDFTQEEMIAAAENGFTSCWTFSNNIKRGRLSDSHRGYLRNIAGSGHWFMLPTIAEHPSGVQLKSWIESSDAGFVKVGVASQNDCSDVVWVDTIAIPASNPNLSHHDYTVLLDRYQGEGHRIVLSPIVNNAYHSIYFFDFHVEPLPGCRPVSGLRVDEYNESSLTVSWNPVGPAEQWIVLLDGQQVAMVDQPTYTVTGLQPYTNYDVTVRSYCGDGDTSDATTATFLTGCTGEECTFAINGHSSTGDGWNGGYIVVTSGEQEIGRLKLLNGSNGSAQFRVCADMPLEFNWYSGNADEVCSFDIVNANGLTVYQAATAEYLGEAFFVTDTICGDTNVAPGPGPGPGPGDSTAVSSVYGDAAIVLCPNPASGMVTLSGVEPGTVVSLIDLNGRMCGQWRVKEETLRMDVAGMAKGTYFARVVGEKGVAVKKLIVR